LLDGTNHPKQIKEQIFIMSQCTVKKQTASLFHINPTKQLVKVKLQIRIRLTMVNSYSESQQQAKTLNFCRLQSPFHQKNGTK